MIVLYSDINNFALLLELHIWQIMSNFSNQIQNTTCQCPNAALNNYWPVWYRNLRTGTEVILEAQLQWLDQSISNRISHLKAPFLFRLKVFPCLRDVSHLPNSSFFPRILAANPDIVEYILIASSQHNPNSTLLSVVHLIFQFGSSIVSMFLTFRAFFSNRARVNVMDKVKDYRKIFCHSFRISSSVALGRISKCNLFVIPIVLLEFGAGWRGENGLTRTSKWNGIGLVCVARKMNDRFVIF